MSLLEIMFLVSFIGWCLGGVIVFNSSPDSIPKIILLAIIGGPVIWLYVFSALVIWLVHRILGLDANL